MSANLTAAIICAGCGVLLGKQGNHTLAAVEYGLAALNFALWLI